MITGGQSYVSAPPAFSTDGRLLLVCSGRTVSVFSTSTAMLVSELEGHEGDVTAVVVAPPPANAAAATRLASYCWTAGLDGVLIYWDFAAAEVVRKVLVGLPVHSMAIPNISRKSRGAEVYTPFAFISVEDTSKPTNEIKALRGQMRIYDLTKGRQVGGLLAETRKPEKIVASSSGDFLGITNKRKLYIWSIPMEDFKPDKIRKIKLRHTKNLTTLAFHSSERIVAGGDVTGRILIWRGFGNAKFSGARGAKSKVDEGRDGVRGEDDADTCTTWHWHSSKVKFLKFSSDGAYLFSGGMEGVIVVWQLDTGKRRYKPRLGSPLLFFVDSPDSSISCVSCTNNQVHLLKMPNMEVMKSIAGIKLPIASPDLGGCYRDAYGFDYTNRLVAIPTEDYCIQFYNLFENTEVSEVQVCERNFQPVDDTTMYISLVSLSIDGNFMCTVDVKLPEEELGGLVTLKFWNHGSRFGQYLLSTVIYEPHSDAGISAVAFRPGKNMAVSTSFGGNFKVWVQSSSLQPSNEKNQSGWRCQSVGSYKKKPMTAAAFSADGSVLAVAAESVITLWDPDNNALVGVIAEALSPVTKLSFIGTSAFLMSVSQSSRPQVAVWNVSNLSMQWSYSLFAEAACCSSSRGSAAVPTSCTGSSSATSASSTSTQRSARKRGRWQQTSSTKLPAWPPYLVIFVLPWMLSEPDIAAPGVNILAAVAQLGNFKEFGAPYYLLSGTSMSCPHVSGIMALLKSFHPNWSPAALKSALMTTALVTDSNGLPLLASGTPTKIADPFDYGAGFVNPNQASDPGLIYDINPSDYQKLFNCTGGSDIDSSCPTIERSLLDLNPPSIAIPNLKTSKTVSRTVTNVGQPDAVYKAFFDPPTGVDMLVEPLMLVFGKNTTSQSFKVTFKATRKVQGDYAFGSLVWQ